MPSYSFYRGAAPGMFRAQDTSLAGPTAAANAGVHELTGLAGASKIAEETRKLAFDNDQSAQRAAAMPGLAEENAAALANVDVPMLRAYRTQQQHGPDGTYGPPMWSPEQSTRMSNSLAQLTGLLMSNKDMAPSDISGPAKTYFADIPHDQAQAALTSADARNKNLQADATAEVMAAIRGGDMPKATQWSSVAHPQLLQQPDKVRTYQALLGAGMAPEKALSAVFEPEAVQALTQYAALLRKPIGEVFNMLHPGNPGVQIVMPPMAAQDATGNPIMIQPDKTQPGKYTVVPGVKPAPTGDPAKAEMARILQEGRASEKAAKDALVKEQQINPALKGLVLIKPNLDGSWVIGTPDGKPVYTWKPK